MIIWDMVLLVASTAVARLLVAGDSEEGSKILREVKEFVQGPDWDQGLTRRIFTVTSQGQNGDEHEIR
jgi:hypothetical protein